MRELLLHVAAIPVAIVACTVGTARAAQLTTDPNAGTDVVVRDAMQPLSPVTITQSADPDTIEDGSSVACSAGGVTTENSWLRLFDLDGDHGLGSYFHAETIDWGIQRVIGAVDLSVNVYCLDESLPFLYQFMVQKDSVVVPLTDQELAFHNTAVFGSCAAFGEDMAIELHAEDCNIAGCQACFIGMNDLGQIAPTYVASASCGVPEPTAIDLGFPCCHLVMKVNGFEWVPDDGADDDDGDVPATTGVGAALLLLILLGGGAYFLRGRVVT